MCGDRLILHQKKQHLLFIQMSETTYVYLSRIRDPLWSRDNDYVGHFFG